MLFKKLFKIIYDSEINCRIEWLWDAGFTWALLDGSIYPRIMKDDNIDNSFKVIHQSQTDRINCNDMQYKKDWLARGNREDIDDALRDMFTAIIEHCPKSQAAINLKDFDENREHFIICNSCGDLMDCRDLGDVFEHEHDKEVSVDTTKIISQRKGDNVAWNDRKKINLN